MFGRTLIPCVLALSSAATSILAQGKLAQTGREWQGMDHSMLADFNLRAALGTPKMTVYELVIAKGGPKLNKKPKKNHHSTPDPNKRTISGNMSIEMLANRLMSEPEIGGHFVIDKTGLTGTYDISLHWNSAGAYYGLDNPVAGPGLDGAPPMAGTGDASPENSGALFSAIEKQLGLKLVRTKLPSVPRHPPLSSRKANKP